MATVLVADDVKSEALLLTQVVQSLGHKSLIADDGESTLRMAQEQNPDLILLDIVMPKVDGFDVCRRLKKDELTARIPIVMVSSKDQRSDKFWAERLGADDYVTKPFQPNELAEKIRKFVG